MNNRFKLNIKKSPTDERDFIAESIHSSEAELPKVYDLRNQLQEIRNQGPYSTCAGHSAACIKEWQEYKDINFKGYMSPQFIYNNRYNQNSDGMYSRDVMKILNKIGIVTEKEYPYTSEYKISDELYNKAKKFKIKGYATVTTVEGLKKALVKNGPCYFTVPVYNYGRRMWKPSQGDKSLGGHAMCCVGYNKQGFIIRNSWGKTWGSNGYTTFPYEDWGLHWEVWTVIDEESGKPIKLPKKENWFFKFIKNLFSK